MVDKQEVTPERGKGENTDQEIREKLEAEGWYLAGTEFPIRTPLNPNSGRFDPVRVKSDKQITDEYLAEYSRLGFSDIKLVPSRKHLFNNPSAPLVDDQSRVYVFMKKR